MGSELVRAIEARRPNEKEGRWSMMLRVAIEVVSGTARFGMAVRAESIRRALDIAEALYPGAVAQLIFPIEPEGFFVEDPAATPGPVELEIPHNVAG
jgi:hypothetical protein